MRIAIALVAGTLAYNLVELGVALAAGTAARSIALVGFGLDSAIECAAGAVVLWRVLLEARTGDRERVEAVERRAARFVGITLLLLALYVTVQAVVVLLRRDAPEESLLGIGLAGLSLLLMPVLAWGKARAARNLGSVALAAEAKETLACAWLSLALLVGLVANATAGWWWADPVAALVMVPLLIREGMEAVRPEKDGS
jgi:divalent metal cation (Fe/Co/Zn/Cd) transporter